MDSLTELIGDIVMGILAILGFILWGLFALFIMFPVSLLAGMLDNYIIDPKEK